MVLTYYIELLFEHVSELWHLELHFRLALKHLHLFVAQLEVPLQLHLVNP